MLDPGEKFTALAGRRARCLVREIGSDVAVGEDDLAGLESGLEFGLGLEAVTGVEQGGEVRINGLEGAEFAIEEATDHAAEPRIVLREAGGIDGVSAQVERLGEQVDLGALAAAVDAFDGDEFSERRHESRPV